MSEKRSTKSLFLIGIMMIALSSPLLSSPAGAESPSQDEESYVSEEVIIGDLAILMSQVVESICIDEETP